MAVESAPLETVPQRTEQQRFDALARANEIRSIRARFKEELKRGAARADDVLAEPPPEFETMKVFDVLLAMPKYGRVKVNRILAQQRISPSKTIGGLSERQRRELLMVLRRRLVMAYY